ncbi:hypothetical protein KP509_1Z079000 [Ceratopteris richardii]|nr:hypothetical protein KP509_1Z079000 [Ceratopteris richardii]
MSYTCYGKLPMGANTLGVYVSSSLTVGRVAVRSQVIKSMAFVLTKSISLSFLFFSASLSSHVCISSNPIHLRHLHGALRYPGKRMHGKPTLFNFAPCSKLDSTTKFDKRSFGSTPPSMATKAAEDKPPQLVVVVESPNKAKALQSYLGSDFMVLPFHGHARCLAGMTGSVRPENGYAMVWEVPESAQSHLARIKSACKSAKGMVLATDPDREGEASAWHISETLKGQLNRSKFHIKRMLYSEITEKTVLLSMQALQQVNKPVVDAYCAQCALDYLIVSALSPLLWRKLACSQCVGRAGFAALQLVCEREKAIEDFIAQEYWTLEAAFSDETTAFSLYPISNDGTTSQELHHFPDESTCTAVAEKLKGLPVRVSKITRQLKPVDPPEPYTTSTLVEDSNAMLGFEAAETMTFAQRLFEGIDLGKGEYMGLITYPFTEQPQLSEAAARSIWAIAAQREFKSGATNMNEPYEAIRPTDMWRFPSTLSQKLDKNALALYTLIWKRTFECQMQGAVYEQIYADLIMETESMHLQTNVNKLSFTGFLETLEDSETSTLQHTWQSCAREQKYYSSEVWNMIANLKEGDVVRIRKVAVMHHLTSPPVRYSEGLLIKAMEAAGIKRPSTYSSALKSLQAKKFVRTDKQEIIPEVEGRMVSSFVSRYLSKFLDCSSIAVIEQQLDEVSCGCLQYEEFLGGFWPSFSAEVASVMNLPFQTISRALQETVAALCSANLGIKGHFCPRCGTGRLTMKDHHCGSGYLFRCDNHLCRYELFLPLALFFVL